MPDDPIIPFIEGDGTGPDIWRASVRVLDAAVAKAYGGKKKIAWMEVYAGEKSFKQFNNWLPDETVEAFRTISSASRDRSTTPVGGGIRSLNVALRQMLDLYRLPAAGPLVQGRAVAGEASGEGRHGDLPREHGRHLRRHRVCRRHARGAEGSRLLRARSFPKEFKKIRFGTEEAARELAGAARRHRRAEARDVRSQVGVGLKPIS